MLATPSCLCFWRSNPDPKTRPTMISPPRTKSKCLPLWKRKCLLPSLFPMSPHLHLPPAERRTASYRHAPATCPCRSTQPLRRGSSIYAAAATATARSVRTIMCSRPDQSPSVWCDCLPPPRFRFGPACAGPARMFAQRYYARMRTTPAVCAGRKRYRRQATRRESATSATRSANSWLRR